MRALLSRAIALIRGKSPLVNHQTRLILILLGINLILVAPDLMPSFAEINPYDEAKYIQSGSLLTRAEIRELAWGPLIAILYAPLHLLLRASADWFMLEAWVGRFLLFAFLWLSTMNLASTLSKHVSQFTVAGVLLVNSAYSTLLVNQSDALFASFSALALAKLILYRRERRIRDAVGGSVIVALAVLTRVEAILLVPLYVALILFWGRGGMSLPRRATAALVPGLAVVAAYAAAFWLSTGSLEFGIGSKGYDSFEVNQSILTGGDLAEARRETRRLFGSAEQNRGSVLRAILRNPPAFFQRILANARNLPNQFLMHHGKRLGPAIVLFSMWGALALIRRHEIGVLAMISIWSLQPLIALGFLASHIIPQVSFVFVVLTAIGVSDLIGSRKSTYWRRRSIYLWIALSAYAVADGKPAFLATGLVLTAASLLGLEAERRLDATPSAQQVGLLLMLCAGLILHGSFSFPNLPALGESPEERAIHYLQEHLAPESAVLLPFPGPALAAGMRPLEISRTSARDLGSAEFMTWLESNGVAAVYLDNRYGTEDEIVRALGAASENPFRRVNEIGQGSIQLFVRIDPGG